MKQRLFLMGSFFLLLVSLLFCPSLMAQSIQGLDSRGVSIELKKPPQKIACLYAFTGHVAIMLDQGDKIVAIVRGLKRDKLLGEVYPRIKEIAVPSRGGDIQIEGLLKTAPELVFLKPETAVITAETNKLDRFHLPYFVAGYHSMAEQMQIIENIGLLLGAEEKARNYKTYYQETIERVQKIAATIPDEERIPYYHSVNEVYRTDAPGTIEADWTDACGGINVSLSAHLQQKSDKFFASMEQILLWNPHVIIANEASTQKEITASPKWQQVKAVKDGKVYTMPIGISRWGHPGGLETPLAMLWTITTLYPEYTTEIDLAAETKEFYKRFFGIEMSEQKVSDILNGKGMRREKNTKKNTL